MYLIIGKKDKNPQRFQEQEEEEAEEGEAEEPSEPKKRSLYKYTISFFDFRF